MKSSAKFGQLDMDGDRRSSFRFEQSHSAANPAVDETGLRRTRRHRYAVALLVRATKLLHFPLVTLALYPREWFPGNWVYLPMAANSLIWAYGISWLIGAVSESPLKPGRRRRGG